MIFNEKIQAYQSQINSLHLEIENLKSQVEKLESLDSEIQKACQLTGTLIENCQNDPELLEVAKRKILQLFEPEQSRECCEASNDDSPTTEQLEPKQTYEYETRSVLLHKNPSIFWDTHANSMRLFLYTKEDAIATFERASAEGLVSRHELHRIDSDSYCLILSDITNREDAEKVLHLWLETSTLLSLNGERSQTVDDEAEDMAEPEVELAGIEPINEHCCKYNECLVIGFKSENLAIAWQHVLINHNYGVELLPCLDRERWEIWATSTSDNQIDIFDWSDRNFCEYPEGFCEPKEIQFSDPEAAGKFSQDLISSGLASKFDIDSNGMLKIFDPKDPDKIDCLLESEPTPKNWISTVAYHRNDTLVIGFRTKKLRNQWAKAFEFRYGGNASITSEDREIISGYKCSIIMVKYVWSEEFKKQISAMDFTLTPDENRNIQQV